MGSRFKKTGHSFFKFIFVAKLYSLVSGNEAFNLVVLILERLLWEKSHNK